MALAVRLLFWALILYTAEALVHDPVASIELEEAIERDEFVFLLKQTKSLKWIRQQPETLFEMRFPGEMRRYSLKLNRNTDVVTFEGSETALSWSESGLRDGGALALQVDQTSSSGARLILYNNCKKMAERHLELSFRDIYSQMEESSVKMSREKHFPVHIIGGPAKDVIGCKKIFDHKKQHDYQDIKEPQKEVMQAQQPFNENEPYRGDIPVISTENCDDLLVRSVNSLIEMIRLLKAEVIRQRGEIQQMKQTLENCAGCKEPDARITCRSNPGPCFTGQRISEEASAK